MASVTMWRLPLASAGGSSTVVDPVGTFTLTFSSTTNGTFAYNIAAPAGLTSDRPAFGLPSMSGSKAIVRNSF